MGVEGILVFSLAFWAMVISATYTANLASFMITKRQPAYPATSLTEAQYRGVPVCVARGLAVDMKITRDYPDVKLYRSEGLTEVYTDLRNNKCGLVADTAGRFEVSKLDRELNPDCDLEWVGRAVDRSSAGPVNIVDAGVYCTSLIGHAFEYYLKEMEVNGAIERAFEQYTSSVTNHQCEKEEEISNDAEESFRLSMVDMGGIFLCHGIACLVGLMVSFFQRCHRARNPIKMKMDDGNEEGQCSGEGVDAIARGEEVAADDKVIISTRQIGSGAY